MDAYEKNERIFMKNTMQTHSTAEECTKDHVIRWEEKWYDQMNGSQTLQPK